MYKLFIRPLLFLLEAETAHNTTMGILSLLNKMRLTKILFFMYRRDMVRYHRSLFGLNFKNSVGLAAGLDKNAKAIDAFSDMGFGFVEIGTVTPKPQAGNPKPRLFRLKKDQSLINRMGFNNDGVEVVKERLKRRNSDVIVGGNIGKNKDTPNENAVDDYLICFDKLFDVVDYFVVNVSSPNTPGLRELQEKGPLTHILNTLMTQNNSKAMQKPILLKIAPDLTNEQLDDIIDIVLETKISGLIATNTTIDRSHLETELDEIEQIGNGGLSGKVLQEKSNTVIEYINNKSDGKIPIIGVGGIGNASNAQDKIKAGASLVQIYSGFIYEGPSLIKNITKALNN
jgi:dihydroorotate dehydrogenase